MSAERGWIGDPQPSVEWRDLPSQVGPSTECLDLVPASLNTQPTRRLIGVEGKPDHVSKEIRMRHLLQHRWAVLFRQVVVSRIFVSEITVSISAFSSI